ncbi:MAG TPA: PAS domain S-box protein, partial [Anaerolineales bacterium]|nr:PAS domain S-box protein [Anaerolineales bacterium]
MALSLSPTLSQSLRFPAELERTFQAEYAEKFMGVTRVALFLSALIMAIFGFLDLWSAPNEVVLHQLWAIRYLMICPAFLGAFLWSFHASFYRWMQVGVSSVVCISGLAIGMMVAMARREDAAFNTYYVGMILITLGAYTFIRLRFGYALASGLIIMAGYEVAALVFQRLLVAPMGPSTFVTANFFFITANFVGAFASYYLEVYTRRDFLQRAALEAEKIKAETMLQQEAADALRRSELRFRAVFDQPLLGVRIYAPDGRLQTWNQATEQFYTMSSQDIVELSQTYNVLDDPSVIANGHLPDIQRAFAGEAVTFPPILLSINQRARWTQHYMYPVKDEAGDVREVVSMSRDITAQKEAEEKLRESEEYYRSLIENSSDGISVLDQDGTLRFASPALARIIGYTPEEMLGQSFEPFIDPAHLANTAAHFQNIVANPGVALTTEIHARHKNGTTVIMENVGKLHPNGKVISNSRDITRRKEAEEKIRKLNEELEQRVEERTAESKRLAAIIEAMPDYVGIASLDGTSLYINHAGRQLVGKPLEDTTDAPAWNVIQCYPPDEIPNLQDMFT